VTSALLRRAQRDRLQELFEEHRAARDMLDRIAAELPGGLRRSQVAAQLRKLGLRRARPSEGGRGDADRVRAGCQARVNGRRGCALQMAPHTLPVGPLWLRGEWRGSSDRAPRLAARGSAPAQPWCSAWQCARALAGSEGSARCAARQRRGGQREQPQRRRRAVGIQRVRVGVGLRRRGSWSSAGAPLRFQSGVHSAHYCLHAACTPVPAAVPAGTGTGKADLGCLRLPCFTLLYPHMLLPTNLL